MSEQQPKPTVDQDQPSELATEWCEIKKEDENAAAQGSQQHKHDVPMRREEPVWHQVLERLSALEIANRHKDQQITTLCLRIDALETENKEKAEIIAHLQSDNEQQAQKIVRLETTNVALTESLSVIKSKSQKLEKEHVEELINKTREVDHMQEELNNKTREVDHVQEELNSKTQEATRAQETLDKINNVCEDNNAQRPWYSLQRAPSPKALVVGICGYITFASIAKVLIASLFAAVVITELYLLVRDKRLHDIAALSRVQLRA